MKWRVLSTLAVLALAPLAALAQQQEGLISGKVTSDAGAPIAGAQVYLEKMNLGTTTKEDGTYRFTVPAARATGQSASLSVKLIGFKPKSVLIALKPTEQTVDFVLAAQAVVLQQVVVTGEGIITTNEKLGETVNIVGSTTVTNSSESNVTNALAAKAPNVQVQSQSADPGSSTSIEIRGLKSFSGTQQPLFVVDGVPLDNTTQTADVPYGTGGIEHGVVAPNRISDVNPNDIESVTILKGAAASAIYGARASQGVVIITTKAGKPGTTRYNFTSSFSANDVTQGYPLQTSFGQGQGGVSGACTNPDQTCSQGKYTWGPALAPGTQTYAHFDEMFVTGTLWDNVLSISGGDDRRSFYFSAGYTANDGIVWGSNDTYDRATVRLKGSQMMGDRMKLGVNFNYVNTKGSFVQRGDNVDGIMLGGLRTPPEFNNQIYLSPTSGMQRSYRFPNPTVASSTTGRGYDNPFWVMTSMPATSDLNRFFGNVDVNWNPNDWFTLQWTPGLDYYTDQRLVAYPQTNSNEPTGQIYRDDFNNIIVSSVLTLVANHTFSPDFQGTATIGNEINSRDYTTNFVLGTGLIAPQPYTISNTVSWAPVDNEVLVHNQSYFGQLTADLYDQLYLTVAMRNDGFSTFAQNDPRAWYPKASASWTFTKSVNPGSWMQFGKLRAAYGETGKPPEPYSTLTTYQVNSFYEYGGLGYLKTTYGGVGGLTSTTGLGTDSLRPERQKEYEAGLDAGFMNGMIDFGFTYYNSKSSDVIINLPLPPSSGASSEPVNAAVITNKGIEFTLNVNSPQSNKNWAWNVGAIWAQNRNLVQSINGATAVYLPNQIGSAVARPGYATGSWEGYQFVQCGFTPDDSTLAANLPAMCAGKAKGTLYVDATGFPVVDYTLRVLGSYQPNWTLGLHGSITAMQKLQLGFLVDVKNGSQAYNGTKGALYTYGTHKDTGIRGTQQAFGTPGFYPGTGTTVGPGAGMQVLIGQSWFQQNGGSFGDNTAVFIENSGFTKLREISLAYTWDTQWVQHSLGLSSVIVRLAGRNLYTWTSYTGLDPETNLQGAESAIQGSDWFGNPQARSLVFSLSLNK